VSYIHVTTTTHKHYSQSSSNEGQKEIILKV